MRHLSNILRILAIAASALFLAGCAKHAPVPQYMSTAQTPAAHRHDFRILRENGVQVIKLGETIRLVLPSGRLFYPASVTLYPSSPSLLNKIAKLLNAYHVVVVKVAAYSDSYNVGLHKAALTNRQAQVIQRYLSDRGIKTRLIYAVGRGDKNPVAWNGSSRGRSCNRRVEISFRFYPNVGIF